MHQSPSSETDRILMVSVHGSPLAQAGAGSAGGMNVFLREVAAHLALKGTHVDIFTRSFKPGLPTIVQLAPGIRLIHQEAGPYDLAKNDVYAWLPEFTERLESLVDPHRDGYSLVHSHYWLSGWVGQRVAVNLRLPHVITFHTLSLVKQRLGGSIEQPGREVVEQDLVLSADRIIAFTPEEAEALVTLYGADSSHIEIVPGGVDPEVFRPGDKASARARTGLGSDDQIILSVGRLDPFKGLEILVRAFAAIEGPRARLLVVGGGPADQEAGRLQAVVESLGIGNRVQWQAAVPQSRLADYFRAADIYVMPSHHESFGLAALEAMACGTPVVATEVGGLKELVQDGRTGRLVPSNRPEELTRALAELLGDAALRTRLGLAARERARQFSWEQSARQQLDVYRKVVRARAQPTPPVRGLIERLSPGHIGTSGSS